jgi:hypothetical protein
MIGEQTDNEIWTRFLFVSSFWMNQGQIPCEHANFMLQSLFTLVYNTSLSYILYPLRENDWRTNRRWNFFTLLKSSTLPPWPSVVTQEEE